MRVFLTQAELSRLLMSRPPEYAQELETVIVERTQRGVVIDTARPAYRVIQAKYDRPGAHRWARGCCDPPDLSEPLPPAANANPARRASEPGDRPQTPQ